MYIYICMCVENRDNRTEHQNCAVDTGVPNDVAVYSRASFYGLPIRPFSTTTVNDSSVVRVRYENDVYWYGRVLYILSTPPCNHYECKSVALLRMQWFAECEADGTDKKRIKSRRKTQRKTERKGNGKGKGAARIQMDWNGKDEEEWDEDDDNWEDDWEDSEDDHIDDDVDISERMTAWKIDKRSNINTDIGQFFIPMDMVDAVPVCALPATITRGTSAHQRKLNEEQRFAGPFYILEFFRKAVGMK
jgi:hypothetical protein